MCSSRNEVIFLPHPLKLSSKVEVSYFINSIILVFIEPHDSYRSDSQTPKGYYKEINNTNRQQIRGNLLRRE